MQNKVRKNDKDEWEKALKDKLSPHVVATILIIPGVKGCPNKTYDYIKTLLLKDIPVPSQIILSSTLEKSKSALYSITNKILI